MDIYLYCLYLIAYLVLLVWGFRSANNRSLWTFSNLVFLVVIGLIVDNGIIVSGNLIGEGPILEGLNRVRFWTHALFTPLLVLFSWDALRMADIHWAKKKSAFGFAVIYTMTLIVTELLLETFGLDLKPERQFGILRYVSTDPATGPPIMILLVTVILLLVGAILWKKTDWKWMFIGTVVMTIGSMVPIPLESAAITNGFELILLLCLVMTKRHQDKLNSRKKRNFS